MDKDKCKKEADIRRHLKKKTEKKFRQTESSVKKSEGVRKLGQEKVRRTREKGD